MKTFYALLIAALFTTAACGKKKDEGTKADPAAKPTEPAQADPAKADPATPEPPKAEPAAGGMTVDQAGEAATAYADKLAKAAADAGDDCEKLGAGLKGLNEDTKSMAAMQQEFEKNAENKKAFEDKFQTQLNEKLKEPMGKIEKCIENADVKAFIETFTAE